MFRALKVFFAFICLVLSIHAEVTASSDVDHVTEAPVTVTVGKLPLTKSSQAAVLNGPVVIASQPLAVSANLRKKGENEVDLEDATPFAVGGPYQVELTMNYPNVYTVYESYGVATIGPNVEYSNGYYGYFSVNLKLRKMIITYFVSDGWISAEFLGIVVTLLTSGANLPQPAYFISSTINTSLMTLTSTPTTITLNWQGISYVPGDKIVIGW